MNDKAETGNSMANQALFDASGNANTALQNLKTM
jgi:arabinogalactan endo-1,4-beta-galactosidase